MSRIRSALLLSCFLSLSVFQLRAQLFSNHLDRRMFSVTAIGGMKSHYPLFSLERSFGNWSAFVGMGGGYIGYDRQEVLYSDANFLLRSNKVTNSKTLIDLPNQFGEDTYLSKTNSRYMGAVFQTGISYYFNHSYGDNRLKGLYAGLSLIYLRTFEYQSLTYREKNGPKSWTYDGMNVFNTYGIELKSGYNWYPGGNEHYCIHAAIGHPFYIPLQEEINITSPFTAGQWEFEMGFGYRIKTR